MDDYRGLNANMHTVEAFLAVADVTGNENYRVRAGRIIQRVIGWAKENRTQLIRIPSTNGDEKRFEVRSPDPTTNPYIAFALIIYAGLDGIKNNAKLSEPSDSSSRSEKLPKFWGEAADIARQSEFIRKIFNDDVESFLRR